MPVWVTIKMNEIKNIRENRKISQSAFAAEFGIPLRTLQEWEQGRSAPPVWAAGLIRRSMPHVRVNYPLPKPAGWKICVAYPFLNCEKIYPIQQRKVLALVTALSGVPSVRRVLIFGSSVTSACHIGSDVDVYVETDDPCFQLPGIYDFEVDLWTSNAVDERLKCEILKKGVCVYERSDTV